MKYLLKSGVSPRWLELTFRDGKTRMALQIAGEPVFSEDMDRMLGISTGKPWNASHPSFLVEKICRQGSEIGVAGRVADGVEARLQFGFGPDGLLHVGLDFFNRTGADLPDAAVGLFLDIPPRAKEKVTLPLNIYHNNPSADPGRIVPHIDPGPGCGYICEEHRLPVPGINVEWQGEKGFPFLSLLVYPSAVGREDAGHYWSLGAFRRHDGLTLASLSGVLLFNGRKDVVYGFKNAPRPWPGGYFRFSAGGHIHKEYVLDWGENPDEGRGFRNLIRSGDVLFHPQPREYLPLSRVIACKARAMDNRWFCSGGAAGYLAFAPNTISTRIDRPPYFLYGWTGQNLKISWCCAMLGIREGNPARIDRCRKAVGFFRKGSATGVRGLHFSTYLIPEKRWVGAGKGERTELSSRMLGENMTDLGDIIRLFRKYGLPFPNEWVRSLTDTADFLLGETAFTSDGIYPRIWDETGKPAEQMDTAAGIPCVQTLIRAYECAGAQRFLRGAEKVLSAYYRLHVQTFERPFAYATMDARCEDKEGGIYFFLAAYDMYRLTGKKDYAEWASLAADWILTFVYFWSPEWKRGSPCDRGHFNCVGWSGVSVQNQHLDVFFPSYELWDFGRLTQNPFYERMGKTIFRTYAQGMCTRRGEWDFLVPGEQGEQYYQTNWAPDPRKWRGGFHVWNPSWILAQVLKPALLFAGREEAKKNGPNG